jgi:hypothetical protein
VWLPDYIACANEILSIEFSDDTPLPQVAFSSVPALSRDEAIKRVAWA